MHCWGSNKFGELGIGFTSVSANLTRTLISDVTALSCNGGICCAISSITSVFCWGYVAGASVSTPANVIGLSGSQISRISVGLQHACILYENMNTGCWGVLEIGRKQGIDADWVGTPVPVQVCTSSLVGTSPGNCVITSATTASVSVDSLPRFGRNLAVYFIAASLKFNSSFFNSFASTLELNISSLVPTSVPPSASVQLTVSGSFDNVVSVSCGSGHSCCIHSSGALSCWGRNDHGQLGLGHQTEQKNRLLFWVSNRESLLYRWVVCTHVLF